MISSVSDHFILQKKNIHSSDKNQREKKKNVCVCLSLSLSFYYINMRMKKILFDENSSSDLMTNNNKNKRERENIERRNCFILQFDYSTTKLSEKMYERNFYRNFRPAPPLALPLGVLSFEGPFLRFKPLFVAFCVS